MGGFPARHLIFQDVKKTSGGFKIIRLARKPIFWQDLTG